MLEHYSKTGKYTLMLRTLVLLVLGLPAVAFSQTQDASISDNVLSIPAVAVNGRFFSVDLTIVADTDPAELELSNAVELSDTSVEGQAHLTARSCPYPRSYWVTSLIAPSLPW